MDESVSTDRQATQTPSHGWRETALGLVGPLGLHLAIQAVQLAMVSMLAAPGSTGVWRRLVAWDADWFIRIARDGYEPGYSYDADGQLTGNGLAFFPLYPLAIRWVARLTGVSYPVAAVTVSWIAAAVAAVLLFVLMARLYNRRVGYAMVALFSAQPMSVALSMGYSEALFCAFVAGMLLAVHRGAWLVAGVCATAAALTRPTGLAAAVALLVAAVVFLWQDRQHSGTPSWRPIVASLAALVAAPLFWFWVGVRVGELDGWFKIQSAGWGSRFDWGASTWRFLRETLAGGEDWVVVSVAFLILGGGLAVLVAVLGRTWLPLTVYGVGAFVLAVGSSGYFHSRPRMLVPVLLLLVPAAVVLGRARPRVAVPVLAGLVLAGCWYGAYMITVWPFTI